MNNPAQTQKRQQAHPQTVSSDEKNAQIKDPMVYQEGNKPEEYHQEREHEKKIQQQNNEDMLDIVKEQATLDKADKSASEQAPPTA